MTRTYSNEQGIWSGTRASDQARDQRQDKNYWNAARCDPGCHNP